MKNIQGVIKSVSTLEDALQSPHWDQLKREALHFAAAIHPHLPEYSERIEQCAEQLSFVQFPNGYQKFRRAWFCRVRGCPICEWRRSLLWKAKAYRFFDYGRSIPNARWGLLTLDAGRSSLEELPERLTRSNRATKRLTDLKLWPGLGWLRFSVINLEDGGEVCLVQKILFLTTSGRSAGGAYLSASKWRSAWQQSMRAEGLGAHCQFLELNHESFARWVEQLSRGGFPEVDDQTDIATISTLMKILHRRQQVSICGSLTPDAERPPKDDRSEWAWLKYGWLPNPEHSQHKDQYLELGEKFMAEDDGLKPLESIGDITESMEDALTRMFNELEAGVDSVTTTLDQLAKELGVDLDDLNIDPIESDAAENYLRASRRLDRLGRELQEDDQRLVLGTMLVDSNLYEELLKVVDLDYGQCFLIPSSYCFVEKLIQETESNILNIVENTQVFTRLMGEIQSVQSFFCKLSFPILSMTEYVLNIAEQATGNSLRAILEKSPTAFILATPLGFYYFPEHEVEPWGQKRPFGCDSAAFINLYRDNEDCDRLTPVRSHSEVFPNPFELKKDKKFKLRKDVLLEAEEPKKFRLKKAKTLKLSAREAPALEESTEQQMLLPQGQPKKLKTKEPKKLKLAKENNLKELPPSPNRSLPQLPPSED